MKLNRSIVVTLALTLLATLAPTDYRAAGESRSCAPTAQGGDGRPCAEVRKGHGTQGRHRVQPRCRAETADRRWNRVRSGNPDPHWWTT